MPRLSIVVPVHNGQNHVRQALLSATHQRYRDLEVIVVDDASTDDSAMVLADMAQHDARVRVVTLRQRVGPGEARNVGLEEATAEHVLFLDADDWLPPGSLQRLVRRIQQTQADVVVFDHVQVMWNGSRVASADAEILAGAPDDGFTLVEYPAVLQTRREVWNKIYRRTFLAANNLRLPPGIYEGVSWSYEVLLRADRIAASPAVSYHYSRRRPGSVLAVAVEAHSDALEQWERVFGLLDDNPPLGRWRGILFDTMTASLLETAHILPERQRERFLTGAAELAAARRPPGHVAPAGKAGRAQQRLVAGNQELLGGSRLVALRGAVKRPVKALLHRGSRVARAVGDRRRRFVYRMQRRRPIDGGLVVLAAELSGPGGGGPAEIASQLQRLAPGRHRVVWLVPRGAPDTAPSGVTTVRSGSAQESRALAEAGHFVYEGTLPADLVKRRGQVVVQTMHSPPMKRVGVDLTAYPVAAKGVRFRRLLAECDRWDVVLSPGQHASEVWQRAFPASYRIMEIGSPRLDVYHRDPDRTRRDTRKAMGVADASIVVLYAPVAREYLRPSEVPTDLDRLSRALPEGFVLAVRPPRGAMWEGAVAPLVESGRVLDAAAIAVEPACMAADVLVTDYSAIMFEFAALDRPIVILAEDLPTFQRVRGTYIDLLTHAPGPVVSDLASFGELLAEGRHATEDTAAARDRFRRRFCGVSDGRSAERAVRALFLGEDVVAPTWSTAGEATAAPTART